MQRGAFLGRGARHRQGGAEGGQEGGPVARVRPLGARERAEGAVVVQWPRAGRETDIGIILNRRT